MQTSENDLLTAALGYAARGWRVHPLRDGDKRPRLADWPNVATTDPEAITEWFTRWPNANVGIATGSGLVVLDSDGEAGEASLRDRELPPTATVRTPRGLHRYYLADAALRNTAGQLGEGVDTRADGGYVVAPPSRNGAGSWEWWLSPDEVDLAPLPPWVAGDHPATADGPLTITAREPMADRLERGEPITTGQRNAELTRVAGLFRRVGLGELETLAALDVLNRERCRPPLDGEEVRRIVVSVARYPRGEVPEAPVVTVPEGGSMFVSAAELLARDIPPTEYLVGSPETGCVLEAESLTIFHGKPRSWKTWGALSLAVSVATGRPWLDYFHVKRARVAVIEEEGGARNWQRRLALCASAARVGTEALDGQLQTSVGCGFRLDEPAWVERLLEELRPFAPELVVMDPLAQLHGAEENAATEMGAVVRTVRAIQRELSCAVILVHHDRKGEALGRRAEQLRGSSALWAAGSTVAFTRQGEDGAAVFIEQKDSEAPPSFVVRFRFGDDSLRITYDGRADAREVVGLSERVLELLQEQGPLSTPEVCEAVDRKKSTVGDALRSLEARSLVEQVGKKGQATIYAAS